MQSIAWYTSLVLILLLSTVFIAVLWRSRDSGDATEVARRGYGPRGKLFGLALAAGVVITAITLVPWPHQLQAGAQVDRIVEASARQWSWSLSDDRARVGERIEFQITSEDVNHGFALYDPDMQLVSQIQAMPGYTNRLQYTFEQPGEYRILCLEFCGLAHHAMTATFTVASAEQH
ncbi:MAG: cytochrome C oxidase subunit II [Pseudomonadota bacterium]|nr:cytochrome C oxidase subunit II [Pseudomonadota bacterium]